MNLLIDVPDGFNNCHLLAEKVFEYVNMDKPVGKRYLCDYTILYRADRDENGCIKKLIKDWNLRHKVFKPINSSGKAKARAIKDMVNQADEALIFFDYNLKDLSSDITIDLCEYNHVYAKVVRLDFNGDIV